MAAELACLNLVRLTRLTPEISLQIADKAGIPPLVRLLADGTPGGQQQAACVLVELAIVPRNRDLIARAGGIERLIDLLVSPCINTPEVAARGLAHLALSDDTDRGGNGMAGGVGGVSDVNVDIADAADAALGAPGRRAMVHAAGGITRLISMLDNSNLHGLQTFFLKSIGIPGEGSTVGMQEQAAATLADIALASKSMQDAIIGANGVPCLLNLMRAGSPLGQEHAARAIRVRLHGASSNPRLAVPALVLALL